MSKDDTYYERYVTDPEISGILDDYLDCCFPGG